MKLHDLLFPLALAAGLGFTGLASAHGAGDSGKPNRIASQVRDGPERVYKTGESFYEEPGSRHPISRNASKTQPAKLLAVFVVDSNDTPMTTNE